MIAMACGPRSASDAVAVRADVEVDLDQSVDAEASGQVDQQADVDAVALDERQLLEHLAAAAVLARQRLVQAGELGEVAATAGVGRRAR